MNQNYLAITALISLVCLFLAANYFAVFERLAAPAMMQPTVTTPAQEAEVNKKKPLLNWPLLINQKERKFPQGSQGGQDGMIEWIFENIGTTNKFYVEFGFNTPDWDGGSGPNCRTLNRLGWNGLLIDGDNENAKINLQKHYIYAENIIELFVKYQVPLEPDYVSVDLDSIDLWVFKAIITSENPRYRPRLISVEYNCHYPLEYAITHQRTWVPIKSDRAYGASLLALQMAAKAAGYTLVGVVDCLDAFFIRNDLIENAEVPAWESFRSYTKRVVHLAAERPRMNVLMDYNTYMATNNEEISKRPVPYLLQSMGAVYGIEVIANLNCTACQ